MRRISSARRVFIAAAGKRMDGKPHTAAAGQASDRAPTFDRERDLREFLDEIPIERVSRALGGLCGNFELLDARGVALIRSGVLETPAASVPIHWELEPIGMLRAAQDHAPALAAAGEFLEALIGTAARYAMARDVHVEAVAADYEALRCEHARLVASEARYRDLSASLERRVAEQVRAIEENHRQLYRTEKLASVGRLAAGVAHEINNPIGFLRSNLATAREYVAKFALVGNALRNDDPAAGAQWRASDLDFVVEDFAALVGESIAGADRVAAIVANLRVAANIDRAEEGLADINELVRAALTLAHGGAPSRPQVDLSLGELPQVLCRPAQISELVLNLLLNAFLAVRREGKIRIRSRCDGMHVELQVEDSGEGIAPDDLPRVFDPFFTTRDVGQGTGLGLTVCRDIVEGHGGTIELTSELGKGTTVTVRLQVGS
jgi:two-component system NtrC family sensor kinase